MKDLTITEVARRAGLRPSAIRYYEQVHLLPPPQRVSGRRRYTPEILRRLSFIQTAQAAGFTLQEIQTLVTEMDASTPLSIRWQTLARQKLVEVDTLMQRVAQMKQVLESSLRCNCPDLDQCMDCIIQGSSSPLHPSLHMPHLERGVRLKERDQ